MAEVNIRMDEKTREVNMDCTKAAHLHDDEITSLLLEAYVTVANDVVRTHECDSPTCHVIEMNKQMVEVIKFVASRHKKAHVKH